jgi:hypothetical protein
MADMEFEMVSREELLEKIKSSRKQLEDLMTKIPEEDFLRPVFDGGWTLKDMLSHIVSWEQKMITWIGEAAEGKLPEMPNGDAAVDALNAAFYQENKDLSLEDARQAFKRSYPQALAVAENTPDEVLYTENLFEGRKNPFWITVAANTYWHYNDHIEDITKWLAGE